MWQALGPGQMNGGEFSLLCTELDIVSVPLGTEQLQGMYTTRKRLAVWLHAQGRLGVLYSLFENGLDDGGTDVSGDVIQGEWVDEQQEVDFVSANDLVIRLPVPQLKLPEVVTPNESAP